MIDAHRKGTPQSCQARYVCRNNMQHRYSRTWYTYLACPAQIAKSLDSSAKCSQVLGSIPTVSSLPGRARMGVSVEGSCTKGWPTFAGAEWHGKWDTGRQCVMQWKGVAQFVLATGSAAPCLPGALHSIRRPADLYAPTTANDVRCSYSCTTAWDQLTGHCREPCPHRCGWHRWPENSSGGLWTDTGI